MTIIPKKKIVMLGMLSRFPVAGEVWLTMQYLIGFQRLGYDAYYVECHGIQPAGMLEGNPDEDSSAKAAAFISSVMSRFDFGDRWAFQALHTDGRFYGMTEKQVMDLYDSAALIINFHGGTIPRPEHSAKGRLIYLGTDPVELEIQLHDNNKEAIEFLAPHSAFFTYGLNYGNPDCRVPVSDRFHFNRTLPPLVLDFWQPSSNGTSDTFTTIGNWKQMHRQVRFQGETYYWSKHLEFLKFLELPGRTDQAFELALSSYQEADQCLLESNGWKVRNALSFSRDPNSYRQYIAHSRGEFTVAKDQNVRLRSGWFSERSAQYLATGRPVITQETGFSNLLPTGQGLFGFLTLDEIVAAVESINSNYERHCRAAADLAREYFSYDVVLPRLLAAAGL